MTGKGLHAIAEGLTREGVLSPSAHDRARDAKFSRSFNDVFVSEGIRVTRTPIRAPNANAFAERWIETLRAECLDWLLILGPRHLDRILRIYVQHYNHARIEVWSCRYPRVSLPSKRPTACPTSNGEISSVGSSTST